MALASLQHIWSVLSQNLKEALDPNIEYTFPVHLHDLYLKKIDIYMYRSCDAVSVILILCIKVDNSFMGELLQGVNKIRAVLYFLKASCVASGLIFQNCEGVLGYYSLNKRRLCWEKHPNTKLYHVESRQYRISICTVLFNSQIVVCSSSTLVGTGHNPQPPSFTPGLTPGVPDYPIFCPVFHSPASHRHDVIHCG